MKLALAILVALQVADVATTAYAINSGAGTEGNPIAASLLAAGGYQALGAAKLAVCAYVLALYLWLPMSGRLVLGFMVRAASVGYVFVVYSNLRVGGLV